MKIKLILSISIFLLTGSCITQFYPDITGQEAFLVIEGMVSDDPAVGTVVKLSWSMPVTGAKPQIEAATGFTGYIMDDLDGYYSLYQAEPGIYRTALIGTVGRKYKLHLNSSASGGLYQPYNHSFESYPVEMKPVPEIDSVYYEKVWIDNTGVYDKSYEGCQIYVSTSDEENNCRFFRWDYDETWMIRLPFSLAINPVCYVSAKSEDVNVKSTAGLSQSVVSRYPLTFISNATDRLKEKYSINVKQYSMSEEEFIYWEKIKAVSKDVGGLYDVTPASIPNNIMCIDDPAIQTLGYFSVSSVKTKRIYIQEFFRGQLNRYLDCVHDTLKSCKPAIPNLNISVWELDRDPMCPNMGTWTTITYSKGCADCTTRGTTIRPSFWR